MKSELSDMLSFDKPAGGLAVWVKFREKFSVPEVANAVSAFGLYMSNGSFYNTGSTNHNALRMGFASLNGKEMEEVTGILKKYMQAK